MKLELTNIICVLERCQLLLGEYMKFPEPWEQEKSGLNCVNNGPLQILIEPR